MFSLPILAQDTLPTVQYSHIENKIYIEYLSPNPAQNQTTIKYFIDDGDTAIIMLTNTTNGSFFNYVLDNTKDFIDIDLSGISSGQYIVNLISGNQVLDTKNLIIN